MPKALSEMLLTFEENRKTDEEIVETRLISIVSKPIVIVIVTVTVIVFFFSFF